MFYFKVLFSQTLTDAAVAGRVGRAESASPERKTASPAVARTRNQQQRAKKRRSNRNPQGRQLHHPRNRLHLLRVPVQLAVQTPRRTCLLWNLRPRVKRTLLQQQLPLRIGWCVSGAVRWTQPCTSLSTLLPCAACRPTHLQERCWC